MVGCSRLVLAHQPLDRGRPQLPAPARSLAEQQIRLQARDVGAVALPDLEHPHERECPDRLTQRAARQTELGRQVGLTWQPRAGSPGAGSDSLADLRDRLLGDACRPWAIESVRA